RAWRSATYSRWFHCCDDGAHRDDGARRDDVESLAHPRSAAAETLTLWTVPAPGATDDREEMVIRPLSFHDLDQRTTVVRFDNDRVVCVPQVDPRTVGVTILWAPVVADVRGDLCGWLRTGVGPCPACLRGVVHPLGPRVVVVDVRTRPGSGGERSGQTDYQGKRPGDSRDDEPEVWLHGSARRRVDANLVPGELFADAGFPVSIAKGLEPEHRTIRCLVVVVVDGAAAVQAS